MAGKVHRSGSRVGLVLSSLMLLAALPAAAADGGRSMVLITLDTTRADRLGAWGWRHAETPNLDALARRGSRFARCDAAVPVTLPSHASLLTGLEPPRHGVRDNGTFVLAERFETVAERLAAAGYDTAAAVASTVLARRYGLAQGFGRYDDDLEASGALERRAGAVTDAALALLDRLEPPYFLWVHYYDPHEPYDPPPPYASRAAARGGPDPAYDGEIAYLDAELGRLLAALGDQVAVTVVGDHGEMLGDGGEPTHGVLLGPGARRVPLILAGAGIPAGRTVDCLVRTVDVAPTLLALAGVEPPAGLDGESLMNLLVPRAACDRIAYSESFQPFFAFRWYPLRALSDGRWLYLHGTRPGLFDLRADPAERRDLALTRPAETARWRARLEAHLDARGEALEPTVAAARRPDDEERARLESLGYLAGTGGGTVSSALPDPRDMVAVAAALHEAAALVASGRCAEALPKLQDVVRRDPSNLPALNQSGLCLMQAGRFHSALNAYRRAQTLDPRAAEPALNEGHCRLQLGDRAGAEAAYARALELDPGIAGAAANLARLERERGDLAAAERTVAAAFAAGSRYPALFLERGVQRAARGDLAAAYDDFVQAVARAPDDVVARENAARAAAMLGKGKEAAAHYQALLARLPGRPDLWAALSEVYLRQLDDRPAARRALERAIAAEPDPGKKARLAEFLRQLDPSR